MANNLVNVIFKIKRGVTSALTAYKTVLEDGELVAELNSNGNRYLKIGDGSNTLTNCKDISTKYADSSNSPTKATEDESGNNIKKTYGSSLTCSGKTISLVSKTNEVLSSVTVGTENGGVETVVDTTQPNSPTKGLIWIDDAV